MVISPRQRDGALHLLLAAVVTAPMLRWPVGRLLGSPNVDVWNHAWGPWWWLDSLQQGRLPWQTQLLQAPFGGVLWFIDPLLAALGAPLIPLLGVAGAYNAVLFAEVVFASWAGRRLARSLGAGPAASWVGATGLTASAWLTCELHNGITEAVNIGPVALALAWAEDAAQARTFRAWALAGLGVGLATLASPYLGLGTGLALLVRGLPSLRTAWLGALVAALVAAPPLLGLRAQLHNPLAIIKHPDSMNEQLALHNAVDPRTFFVPFGFRSVDLSAEGFEHSLYLGLLALALAAVALWTAAAAPQARSRWLWGAALGLTLLCSLGPYLFWSDGWLEIQGHRLRLPWWWLQKLAPGLAITHPLRLGVPALAITAALAALGAERLLGPRAGALAVAVALDGLLLSGAPWPLQTAPGDVPPIYDLVSADASNRTSIVLDLPTDAAATMRTSRYLYWQAAGHHQPIPYGPDARASTSSLLSSNAFRALAALCRRRPDEHQRLGFSQPFPAVNLHALRERKVRWIVLHQTIDPEVTPALQALLTRAFGEGTALGDALLWDLQDPSTLPTAPRSPP